MITVLYHKPPETAPSGENPFHYSVVIHRGFVRVIHGVINIVVVVVVVVVGQLKVNENCQNKTKEF